MALMHAPLRILCAALFKKTQDDARVCVAAIEHPRTLPNSLAARYPANTLSYDGGAAAEL